MSDSFTQEPEKMTITDLSTGETVEMQFNPEELNEAIEASYGKQQVQGLSHTVKQFANTSDVAIDFRLYLTSNGRGPSDHALIMDTRSFLHSLFYPRGRGAAIKDGGPPRILFVWPEMYSLVCNAVRAKFNYSKFRLAGAAVIFTAEVSIEEFRIGFISSEDVRQLGTRRSAQAGGR